MEVRTINAALLAKMFLAGARNLDAKKDWINELNVFPVPDGDTGTNMTMTIMSAAKEVSALGEPQMDTLSKAISSGSLRGARGNSGVILSQLFRGFCKVVKKYDEIDIPLAAEACQKAVETAYKAVMKPKEGTILTVAKGAADKAQELAGSTDDFVYFMDEIIKHADYVLSQTPEMLPVLKQAGVVDSGGQGLMQVLKGAFDALCGREIDYAGEEAQAQEEAAAQLRFGYVTDCDICAVLTDEQKESLTGALEALGEEIAILAEGEKTILHIHTNDPGMVLQKALEYGALTGVCVGNIREEADICRVKDAEIAAAKQAAEEEARKKALEAAGPKKDMGFIAVSIGEGMNEIFRGLGCDYIIEGGQTMNPSTEDMLKAIDRVNADHIFILPNNSNIIMAANQAVSLVENKEIIVIPTKTVPQGITAMINFIPDYSAEENKETMLEEIAKVKTGQVTYAVRDTEIDGKVVKKNDFMGMDGKTILANGTDLKAVTLEMVSGMIDDETAVVTIYFGADSTEESAQEIADAILAENPDLEVEVSNGGQPIYYYVISVE